MPNPPTLSRRHVLQAGGAAGLAAALGLSASGPAAAKSSTAQTAPPKIVDLGPAVVQFSLMSSVLVGDIVYIGSRNLDPVRIVAFHVPTGKVVGETVLDTATASRPWRPIPRAATCTPVSSKIPSDRSRTCTAGTWRRLARGNGRSAGSVTATCATSAWHRTVPVRGGRREPHGRRCGSTTPRPARSSASGSPTRAPRWRVRLRPPTPQCSSAPAAPSAAAASAGRACPGAYSRATRPSPRSPLRRCWPIPASANWRSSETGWWSVPPRRRSSRRWPSWTWTTASYIRGDVHRQDCQELRRHRRQGLLRQRVGHLRVLLASNSISQVDSTGRPSAKSGAWTPEQQAPGHVGLRLRGRDRPRHRNHGGHRPWRSRRTRHSPDGHGHCGRRGFRLRRRKRSDRPPLARHRRGGQPAVPGRGQGRRGRGRRPLHRPVQLAGHLEVRPRSGQPIHQAADFPGAQNRPLDVCWDDVNKVMLVAGAVRHRGRRVVLDLRPRHRGRQCFINPIDNRQLLRAVATRDGVAYLGGGLPSWTAAGTIVAFDPVAGKELWRIEPRKGAGHSALAVQGRYLYGLTRKGGIFVLDIPTRKLVHTADISSCPTGSAPWWPTAA